MAAVKAVFPDASVSVEGGNGYPIKVVITREADGMTVWSGSQKDLFRKYGKRRSNAIKQIQKVLKSLAQ